MSNQILHPLEGLSVIVALGIFLFFVQVVLFTRQREQPSFGFAALQLVAWLDAFAFLSGFSIGWVLSIANIFLGAFLWLVARHYRYQILIAAFVSLLLALFLRGFFAPSKFILYGLLAAIVFVSGLNLIKMVPDISQKGFGGAALGLVAGLAGLSLLVNPDQGSWIALAAIGIGALLLILAKHYRPDLLLIIGGSLLWYINIR